MVYCIGDSLTEGRPGISYVKFLSQTFRCKNCGLGGDTVIGVKKRFEQIIGRLSRTDAVVLGIGSNDILIPYFESGTSSWRRVAARLKKRGSVPCADLDAFENQYATLLTMIQTAVERCVVFGIPLLENADALDKKAQSYNNVIQTLCQRNAIPFLDIRTWQKEQKENNPGKGDFFMTSGRTNMNVALDTLLTTYLPLDVIISQKRGLSVTVDGCHFNSLSATGLALLVAEQFNNQ